MSEDGPHSNSCTVSVRPRHLTHKAVPLQSQAASHPHRHNVISQQPARCSMHLFRCHHRHRPPSSTNEMHGVPVTVQVQTSQVSVRLAIAEDAREDAPPPPPQREQPLSLCPEMKPCRLGTADTQKPARMAHGREGLGGEWRGVFTV
ncbi:unnamed protein product [Pleuronectes platessa]|uniref:Uncharacterized protein n=1 Tax=Pleuronectes platessa TaxID=8262 RepID=A0A9N7Z121_PLEPL|nr:unnamed protein product [Pleuronectes platessa]